MQSESSPLAAPGKNKIFFPNLDGLRFLAFILVFWQHSSEPLVKNLKSAGVINDEQLRYFVTGGLGVSFFFVLSGFLITYLLMDEKIRNGAINKKAFYIRRVLRIFPLYYLVVAWGFGLYPLIRALFHLPPIDNGSFPLYALFLVNFDTIYSSTDHSGFVGDESDRKLYEVNDLSRKESYNYLVCSSAVAKELASFWNI